MKWLRRATEPGLCWCKCDPGDQLGGICSVPGSGQLDCPWCGCGWMFACLKCHKAFVFAEAFELPVSVSANDMARWTYAAQGWKGSVPPRLAELANGVSDELQARLVVGSRYALLDGRVLGESDPAAFQGAYAQHNLARAPQFMDPTGFRDLLEVRSYWLKHRKVS